MLDFILVSLATIGGLYSTLRAIGDRQYLTAGGWAVCAFLAFCLTTVSGPWWYRTVPVALYVIASLVHTGDDLRGSGRGLSAVYSTSDLSLLAGAVGLTGFSGAALAVAALFLEGGPMKRGWDPGSVIHAVNYRPDLAIESCFSFLLLVGAGIASSILARRMKVSSTL